MSILMVTHNNLHLTREAIKSCKLQLPSTSLLVVDNNSTDGTQDYLRTGAIHSIFITSPHSLAYSWNIGLRYLFSNSDEVLVVNNDVILRSDTHDALRFYASHKYIQAAVPDDVARYGHNRGFVTCRSVDSTLKLRAVGDTNSLNLLDTANLHPDFSCFMITKQTFKRVGDFDEKMFPAYYEDNDYHVRMHRAGITAISVDLPFVHHGAQTIKNCSRWERRQIEMGAARNAERFYSKYGCLPTSPEYARLFVNQ